MHQGTSKDATAGGAGIIAGLSTLYLLMPVAAVAAPGAETTGGVLAQAAHHLLATPRQLHILLAFAGLVILGLLTALTRRNRQLAMSRAALRVGLSGRNSILANLPEPVWLKDASGVYLACNPAFERLYGASEEELVGQTDFDLTPIEAARLRRKQDRAAIEAGRPVNSEEWMTFANDGHCALLLITEMPMYDDAGQLIGVLGIGRDITDQRKTEMELRRRQSYQKAMLDNFPFMVWLKDTDGRFLATNQAVARAAGLDDASELVGRTDEEVWPQDLAAAYRIDDREVMTKRHKREAIEEVGSALGRTWVESYKAPVISDYGDLLGTVGFARDVSERMAMEQALRDSETRFRGFFESNSSVMLLVDPTNGEIVDANRAAEEFYGYDAVQLRATKISEINTLDLNAVSSACAAARRGERNQFSFRHRLAGGEIRDVDVFATPITSGGRELLFAIVHDITERRRAETALARERDLFSAGPVVVFAWEPQAGWPVRYVSSNVEPVLGYSQDELTDPGFRFASLIHPDDRERTVHEAQAFLDQGVDRFELSYRLRRKHDGYAWFHDFSRVSRDETGAAVAVHGYLFDETTQKNLELSLNEQRERLQWVIEGTRAGTWEWNVQTGETRFNERWAEIIGYTLAELAPVDIKTWLRLAHPVDRDKSADLLEKHFAGEIPYYEVEARMRHKDGSWVWVLDRGRVFEWTEDGKPLWMAGTHQDITDRKLAELGLRDGERRLRTAGKVAYDLIYEWDIGRGSLEWFGNVDNLLGYQASELPHDQESWLQLVHPEDRDGLQTALAGHRSDAAPYQHEYRVLHKDGSYRFWLDKASPLTDEDGQPYRWIGVCTDITERMQSAEKQRLAATVFSHALEGIIITDRGGDIIDVNDAFTRITGYSRDEVLGANPRLLQSGRHGEAFYRDMWHELRTKGQWSGEIWNRRKNGEIYAELMSVSAVYGRDNVIQNFVALFSDISAQKQHESELEHIAYFDPLTGLPNRVLLYDRVQRALVQAQRHQLIVSVLYLDLDGFKDINDRFGHDIGDKVLAEVGARLRGMLREEDTVARIGGDEFVAVLVELPDTLSCVDLLPRLLARIAEPMQFAGHQLAVTASLGVTFYPQSAPVDVQQLLREADQAMYQAKVAGKNRYYLYDGGIKRGLESSGIGRQIGEGR